MSRVSCKSKWFLWVAMLAAMLVAAAVGVVVPAAGAPPASPPPAPSCTAGTIVNTQNGPVCGLAANGVTSYLGIPYAAPPVGALRWHPPAPVTPSMTTFQATEAGVRCPQPAFPAGSPPPVTSEDCLTLNLYVPPNPGAARLPVMVEIHGGGFIIGGPPDGTHLAATGHVIMVSIHYRLGILGFLANKTLGAHSGDYGLQDQQAALRWVKRNIARFGGNPHNVTLFGQSAGGASVCDAAVSPTAVGLFQKGISESGFYNYRDNTIWPVSDCKSQLLTEAQAQKAGASFATKVGCGAATDVAACLRGLPVQTLLTNGGQVLDPTAGGTIGPTINGTTLPISPGKAFKTGQINNNIRLMIGVARDEFNGGVYTTLVANTPAQYRALVRQQFGALAPTVMALYPLSRFPNSSPFIAYRTVMADSASVCPALVADHQLARHIPVYAFENDNADTPTTSTLPLGAFHNAENPFLFPSGTLTFGANQTAFGDQVIAEWAGFARTGNPTVPGTPRWTRYSHRSPLVMSLVPSGDSALTPADTINLQHHCGFWDAVNRTAPWAPR